MIDQGRKEKRSIMKIHFLTFIAFIGEGEMALPARLELTPFISLSLVRAIFVFNL